MKLKNTTKLQSKDGSDIHELPSQTAVEVHPYALMYPAVKGEQLEGMKRTIAAQGQLHPGTFNRAMVQLDGRTRKMITDGLGLPFKFRYFDGTPEEEVAFIDASNVDRRQMSLDAAAALRCKYWLPIFREGSKAALSEGGARGGARAGKAKPSEKQPSEKSPKAGKAAPKPAGQVLAMFAQIGVSEYRARICIKLFDKAQDLLNQVIEGERTLNQADKEFKERLKEDKEANREADPRDGRPQGKEKRHQSNLTDQDWEHVEDFVINKVKPFVREFDPDQRKEVKGFIRHELDEMG